MDAEFEEQYPSIPWRVMYGLRNKIVHDYEGVNLVLIWDIIKEDLPELKKQLEELNEKFDKIKDGKGVAFTIPLKSIIGVSIYQFLSNNRAGKGGEK